MAFEGAYEIFNTVYIAKKLFDMGKYDLVKSSVSDTLAYDFYYENMFGLIENIFEHHECRYYENCCTEVHVVSDKVIVDFYRLAGRYGRRNGVSEADNLYIKAARQEVRNNLDISHCLDWKLMGYAEPKRKFHSRLGLFISHECDCLDLGVLAFRLIEIHEWFADMCVELCNILDDTMGGQQISLQGEAWEEALAA